MIHKTVLFRIGTGDYAVSINTETSISMGVFRVGQSIEQNQLVHVLDHTKLPSVNFSSPLSAGKYLFFNNNNVVAFEKLHTLLHLSPALRNEAFKESILRIVEQFKRNMWQQLIKCIYFNINSVEDVLKQICNHTFSEHYSLWLYNKHTAHFHMHCASFSTNTDYVQEDDPDSTLKDMLAPNSQYISRTIENQRINSDQLASMCWLNRFRIDDGLGLIAVLSFYSQHTEFHFSEQTNKLIPEIVSSKLSSEFSSYLDKHMKIRDFSESYSPGNLTKFLRSTLPPLTQLMGWETASIFFTDENKPENLRLIALAKDGCNMKCPDASYELSKPSLTSDVYHDGKLVFSYNIESDVRNTHGFDEPTTRGAVNWMGIPIARPHEPSIGVFRVLNKLSKNGEIVPFNTFDIDLLRNIASIIAYLYNIEEVFQRREQEIQADLSKQEMENKELNDYLKTFRHELKSPLTVVTQASNTIRRALKQSGICTEDKLPKKIEDTLSDLDMVGDRLMFVTNLLTFEAQELVKDIENVRLLQDIVTPVMAFSVDYARHRKKNLKIDKSSLLQDVYCDAMAASMVFHTLIDNAIKYSKADSTIVVRGQSSGKYCQIVIENYGLPILSEEREDIFRRYYRGQNAEQQKTEGSGIGLHLAREIMNINHGNIVLERLSAPTTFVLSIERTRKDRK